MLDLHIRDTFVDTFQVPRPDREGETLTLTIRAAHARRRRPIRPHEMAQAMRRGRPVQPLVDEIDYRWTVWVGRVCVGAVEQNRAGTFFRGHVRAPTLREVACRLAKVKVPEGLELPRYRYVAPQP